VLPTVKHAASTLVESLTRSDRASVMTFGGVMRQSAPFTTNRGVLLDAIRDMSAAGSTPLFDALYIALRSFGGSKAAGELKRRAIVVFTDGDDTASLTTYDTVLQTARESGIAVYTVLLKSVSQTMNGRTTQNDFQMRRLAEETGARALVAFEESNIDPLYKSIANELAHQYSLGYVPAGVAEKNDKNQFARIAVSVRGRNLTVRTRSGYMARN
jgi:Ca-activated chloride channel homolog